MPQLDRRIPVGDRLARVLLAASTPLRFDELRAAAPDAPLRDVGAWIEHAMQARLLQEAEGVVEGDRQYRLCARGRRVLGAQRREWEQRERAARTEQGDAVSSPRPG